MVALIVGILAVAFYLLSYQMKRRKYIIIVNATSSFLYILQYILVGAFEGAILDSLALVSAVGAGYKDKKPISSCIKVIIILINLLIVVSGVLMYRNIYTWFSVIGASMQISALWITKEKTIRLLSLAGAPFWLVYNFASGAYGSAIGSVLSIFSLVAALIRYDLKK